MKTRGIVFDVGFAGGECLAAAGMGRASPAVLTTETAEAVTFDNSAAAITLAKSGQKAGVITSIKAMVNGSMKELGNGANAMAFDFDNHTKRACSVFGGDDQGGFGDAGYGGSFDCDSGDE